MPGSGVDTVVFERSPAGAGTWTATPASWDTASGPDAVADGDYDLRVDDDRQRRQLLHAPRRSPSRRPHGADDLGVARAGLAEQRAGHGQLHARATAPAPASAPTSYRVDGGSCSSRQLRDRRRAGRPLERRLARRRSTSRPTTSATSRRRRRSPSSSTRPRRAAPPATRALPARDRQPDLLDRRRRRQLGPVPVLARRRRRLVEHRRRRHLAAVRGLLEHDARRRRPVRPARGRHRHHRQRRERAPARPAEDGRQHRSGAASSPRPPRRRSSPARVNVTANASDGAVPPASGVSAVRFEIKPSGAGSFTRLRHADRSGRRLDLPAVARDRRASPTAPPTSTSSSPTSPATRRPRRTHTINVDNDAPVVTLDDPGAAVGRQRHASTATTSRRHGAGRLRATARSAAARWHGDRVRRDARRRLRRHLDDRTRRRAAVRADRGRAPTSAATPRRAHRGRRCVDRTQPTGSDHRARRRRRPSAAPRSPLAATARGRAARASSRSSGR